MKTLLIALVCLVTGYVAGAMLTTVPVAVPPVMAAKAVSTPTAEIPAAGSTVSVTDVTAQALPGATHKDTITALQSQIALLEQQLVQQATVLERSGDMMAQRAANTVQRSAKPAMSEIALSEVEKVLPPPFANLIAASKGSVVDRFQQLESETIDYEWAPLMEQRITDFISMHQLSGGIQLQAVRCKSSLCEIRGFELEDRSWSQILSNMQAQPWWQFDSSHSSGKTSAEFGQFFYMVAARTL